MNIIKDYLLQLSFIATLIFTFQIFFAERAERDDRVKIILSVLFGLSILLCMTFPMQINPDQRIDIRIIPLLLGTLYGGWRTGIVLSVLIIMYRSYLGVDIGLYTTFLTLLFSMPVIIFFQTKFARASKNRKMQIALLLIVYYCLVGILSVTMIRGFSIEVFQVQLIYILITVVVVFFFIYLNEMIQDMNNKNRQLQSDIKDAEIAFLRSQIKPHFLYNALNSIASLCIDEPHKAEELTLDLAQYLRSSFDFKQLDSLTTLENELELVKAYINIEKARFGTRLDVEYNVDANLNTRIPPLIVQPLVENAIKHGLMSNLQGGTVRITVKQEIDAGVSFVIEDNGCGMTEDKREEILKVDVQQKGIGLWNINRRIQLLYGVSLLINSEEGMGTKVMFHIPTTPSKHLADAYDVSFAPQNF